MLDAPKTSFATPFSGLASSTSDSAAAGKEGEGEGDVWFDWSFCEFWKMNFCTSTSHSFLSLFPRLLLPFLVLPLPVSRLLSLRPFRSSLLRHGLSSPCVFAFRLCTSCHPSSFASSSSSLRSSFFSFVLHRNLADEPSQTQSKEPSPAIPIQSPILPVRPLPPSSPPLPPSPPYSSILSPPPPLPPFPLSVRHSSR